MKERLREFLDDLTVFSTDLIAAGNRATIHSFLLGRWVKISRDNYRRIPLLLTVMFHLGVLLFAIGAPYIMFAPAPKIPEIYTVNLFNAYEAPVPPPLVRVVKTITPASPPKAAAPKAVSKDVVSLSPLRQRLEKEMKEKEARKKEEKIRRRQMEKVRLELLQEQADNEVKEAEAALAEAKKEVASKISDLYRTVEAPRNDAVAATTAAAGSGKKDQQMLEALEGYRARLFEHISPYWQLPELQEWDESLRAVIVMQVRRDGTITSSYFEKRSKNLRFNQYAMKAIENAQPLPPFPLDFNEKSEEIAVTFSPGGLL